MNGPQALFGQSGDVSVLARRRSIGREDVALKGPKGMTNIRSLKQAFARHFFPTLIALQGGPIRASAPRMHWPLNPQSSNGRANALPALAGSSSEASATSSKELR